MFGSSGACSQRHTYAALTAGDEENSGTAWSPELHLIVPKHLVQPKGLAFLLHCASGLILLSEHQGKSSFSTPGVTEDCSSPLTHLERTMHGTGGELVISQRAPGYFAVL